MILLTECLHLSRKLVMVGKIRWNESMLRNSKSLICFKKKNDLSTVRKGSVTYFSRQILQYDHDATVSWEGIFMSTSFLESLNFISSSFLPVFHQLSVLWWDFFLIVPCLSSRPGNHTDIYKLSENKVGFDTQIKQSLWRSRNWDRNLGDHNRVTSTDRDTEEKSLLFGRGVHARALTFGALDPRPIFLRARAHVGCQVRLMNKLYYSGIQASFLNRTKANSL